MTTSLVPLSRSLAPRRELPDHLLGFAAIHDAMVRDAERLVLRAPTLASADLPPLQRWWTKVERAIVHHHEREDSLVFPTLQAKAPDLGALVAELHADHERLDEAMAAVGGALGGRAPEAVAGAAVTFRDVLVDHLSREEAAVFPAITAHLGAEEHLAMEKEMSKGSTLREVAFELPWVGDGADARFDALVAELLPAPIRLLDRLLWERAYRRLRAPLVGGGVQNWK